MNLIGIQEKTTLKITRQWNIHYLWNFERKSCISKSHYSKPSYSTVKISENKYAKCFIYEPILKYKNKANKILEGIFHIKVGDIGVGKSGYKVRARPMWLSGLRVFPCTEKSLV